VINVGAGAGSSEPQHTMLAVEPSATMISQRPASAAPVVRAHAEALPVADDAVDAAMALLTVHHWTDLAAKVAELRRIARRRIVVLTWDQRAFRQFWLVSEYLPEAAAFDDARALAGDQFRRGYPGTGPYPGGVGSAQTTTSRQLCESWLVQARR
jgi:hypothetical protein